VRPVDPCPHAWGGQGGVVSWGWFTPGEIRIPCRFVSRSRPTTILKHGGLSQSVTITTVLGVAIPCHTQFWAIFSGVFLGINISMFFFLSRADDFDFPCRAVGSRSTNEEVEHTHSAGGHGNQVKWATPATVATIGRQKLRDGFGSSQLAFGTSWCFRRETNPWQLLIDGALKSRKVPVRLNSYQCNYLLFGFTQFFCVFFWLIFGQFWYRFWPRRTRWKTNLFFFWIFIFFFRAELAKVLVDGWILVA